MDIASLLEVEVKEGKPSELQSNVSAVADVVAHSRQMSAAISHDERHFYKLTFGSDIASVRFRKLHCTACDIHIGSAPADAHNMHEHPVLHVLLCTNCRSFYGDGTFEQGDDATDMFCRWCANGGNLYCCSYCSNTFCSACIKRNFDVLVRKKIERDEKWKCFVCNPADLYSARAACWALLQHVQTVTRILQSDRKMSPEEIEAKMNLDESQCCPHKKKRKRGDTPSDDEEEDETFTLPKRKRRKIMNAKRAKRLIKLEMPDASPGVTENPDAAPNPRHPPANHADDVFLVDTPSNDRSPDEEPPAERQTRRRLRSRSSNATSDSERPKFASEDEIPPPLLQFDQTMVEGAESLSFGALSPGSRPPLVSAPRTGITPVPTAHLLKKPVAGPAIRGGRDHRIIRTTGPLYVRKIQHVPPGISQPGSNAKTTSSQSMPMVSIPSRNHVRPQAPSRINVAGHAQPLQTAGLIRTATGGLLRPIRPRIVLAKPIPNPNIASRNANSQPPSVIDLESDEDEPAAPAAAPSEPRTAQESNDRVPELSTLTFPVRPDDGILTILSPTPRSDAERSDGEEENGDAARRSKDSARSFELAIRGPTKSIDAVLDSLKNKLKRVLESAMIFSPDKELVAAKAKTRAVNRTIKRTVEELTSLSENLVGAYQAYKRECNGEGVAHTARVTLGKRERSCKTIALDMKCTRESEPESDEAESDEDSENSRDISPVREIRPYRTRISRGTDAKPETEDKAVQAYDVVTRDYEKSMGYALLLKADYDSKRECDILRPVMVPDENFGKYEEEFISYLQFIEDRRSKLDISEEEEEKEAEVFSVKDLVEADLGLAPETMGKPEANVEGEKRGEEEKSKTNDENVEIMDEHLEISITTTTTTQSSSSDSDSDSSSSDSETGTSEAGSPRKKKRVKTGEETTEETTPETTPEKTKEATKEAVEETRTENEEKKETPSEEPKIARATDEETVLAVRALIEEDSGDNSGSNAGLNSWKPVESDDECTVLD